MRVFAEHRAELGSAPIAFVTWIVGASDITRAAAVVLGGYVCVVSIVFVILGFFLKGDPEEPAATD